MTDKQLAVLLFQLVRQLNQCGNLVEQSLLSRGASILEVNSDLSVIEIRGLAQVLQRDSAVLERP